MKIFFLKYESGNGYSCGCCSRWEVHAEILRIDAEDDDIVQTLIQAVESEMSAYSDINLLYLVDGATGIDYSESGIPNLFDKLMIARDSQRGLPSKLRELEQSISRVRCHFDGQRIGFDRQLADGLITKAGHLKWIEELNLEMEHQLAPLQKSLADAKAKAASLDETANELRQLIGDQIRQIDSDQDTFIGDR